MSVTTTSENSQPTKRKFILASRASQLAQIQTNLVLDTLRRVRPSDEFEASFMSTEGDKNQSQALYLLGGKALWTKELEVALKEGLVDMLVHCCKDVPTTLPDGCELGAVLEREDPVDSLVVKKGLGYKSLEELPEGSVVGTSSVRRVAQLKRAFPGLKFADVRGNLNTRIAKLDAPTGVYSALILAKAGLVRLGWGDRITADISTPTLYYAVGQGALVVEIRAGDESVRDLCKSLTHWKTEWACRAERSMLRVLEGGCSVPVGAHTSIEPIDTNAEGPTKSKLTITGTVTAMSGSPHVEHTLTEEVSSVEEADALGSKLAKILIETGGKEILDEIFRDREARKAEERKVIVEETA